MAPTGGCVPVVERVGSSLSHSREDPVVESVAPSFGEDDLLGETVGAFSPSRADPAIENAAPRSFGRDDLLGETVGAFSLSRTDPAGGKR